MVEYIKEEHSFFADFLSDSHIKELFREFDAVSLEKGDLLFDCSQQAEGLYIVASGRLAVQKSTGFGDRLQVVAILETGAPVGEGGLVPGYVHGTTVTAIDSCELLFLSFTSFTKLCEVNPHLVLDVYGWLLKRVSTRLNVNTERLAHIL